MVIIKRQELRVLVVVNYAKFAKLVRVVNGSGVHWAFHHELRFFILAYSRDWMILLVLQLLTLLCFLILSLLFVQVLEVLWSTGFGHRLRFLIWLDFFFLLLRRLVSLLHLNILFPIVKPQFWDDMVESILWFWHSIKLKIIQLANHIFKLFFRAWLILGFRSSSSTGIIVPHCINVNVKVGDNIFYLWLVNLISFGVIPQIIHIHEVDIFGYIFQQKLMVESDPLRRLFRPSWKLLQILLLLISYVVRSQRYTDIHMFQNLNQNLILNCLLELLLSLGPSFFAFDAL